MCGGNAFQREKFMQTNEKQQVFSCFHKKASPKYFENNEQILETRKAQFCSKMVKFQPVHCSQFFSFFYLHNHISSIGKTAISKLFQSVTQIKIAIMPSYPQYSLR